jgi:hypothetical protein
MDKLKIICFSTKILVGKTNATIMIRGKEK